MWIKILGLMVLLSICFWGISHATTYTCGTNGVNNSCTPAGLTTLIAGATTGDTINIATGTHNWTSSVTINKRITINGGGTYSVDSNKLDTGSWPVQLNTASGGTVCFLINVTAAGTVPVIIRGIHIYGNGSGGGSEVYNAWFDWGMICEMYTNISQVRITNSKFTVLGTLGDYQIAIHTKSALSPSILVDNCYFREYRNERKTFLVQRMTANEMWVNIPSPNGSWANGNYSWGRPVVWGSSSEYVFIEDCVFYNTGAVTLNNGPIVVDMHVGGRAVFRYNYVLNGALTIHSLSNGSWTRSGVCTEIYNNTFVNSASPGYSNGCVYIRSGNALIYNNVVNGNYATKFKFSDPTQEGGRNNWGSVTGSNTVDGNWGGGYPAGYPLMDQIGWSQSASTFSTYAPNEINDSNKYQIQPQVKIATRVYGNTGTVSTLLGWYEYSGLPGSGYIGLDRDYYLSADPAYTAYTYPHPLIGGSSPEVPTLQGVTIQGGTIR